MKIRWKNFKGFKDTGPIDFKALTILIGPNGSGKSTIFQPLLLLSQTISCHSFKRPLLTSGELISTGNYKDTIYKHDLTQILEFEINFEWKPNRTRPRNKVGDTPPTRIILQFGEDKPNGLQMINFIAFDHNGNKMLERKLNKGNKRYGLYFCKKFVKNSKRQKEIYNVIKNQSPTLFYFDIEEIIRSELDFLRKEENKKAKKLTFSESVSLYISILGFILRNLQQVTSTLRYIGPMREIPKRIYEYWGELHGEVGPKGQYTYSMLYQLLKEEEKKRVLNRWLKKMDLANSVYCKPVPQHPHLLSIYFKTIENNVSVNYADSCFGLSQVLPVLIQFIMAKPNDTIIIEQPELHMNPRLEVLLAEFIAEMVNQKHVHCIIETHSEHILMRIRSLIKSQKLHSNDLNIYFTEILKGERKVRKINIDSTGNFPNNDWPKGFFSEALSESLRFATIHQGKK